MWVGVADENGSQLVPYQGMEYGVIYQFKPTLPTYIFHKSSNYSFQFADILHQVGEETIAPMFYINFVF